MNKDEKRSPSQQELIYQNNETLISFQFNQKDLSIWATVQNIADLFQIDVSVVRKHINNIYEDRELEQNLTSAKNALVQNEGARLVKREVYYYNLDVILSVGYRTNSKKATLFRQWSTIILKNYLEQGYIINEQVLRDSPEKLNQLAAKVRSLRSEEKQVYAKVRECFKICASDYNPSSQEVKSFYALLQDKFHHAITKMTSSQIIMDRADYTKENMGLVTLTKDFPTLKEAEVGKNYLNDNELYRLHLLSEQFLLFAESTALAEEKMTMESLRTQLDRLLTLNNYPVFSGYKDYIKEQALDHARREHKLYKIRIAVEKQGICFNEELYHLGEYSDLINL
jgi:hypothetical protein